MKKVICLAIFTLALLHGTVHVESRRHRDDRRPYKLFVFGDTLVDNGNVAKGALWWATRAWYKPYGMSFTNHSNRPTGRFSDGKVESDFVAMILGHDESPAPENAEDDGDDDDTFGMNFAAYSTAKGSKASSSFAMQINLFKKLMKHGVIDKDISQSVALVAFSCYDYHDVPREETDHDGFVSFIDGVTDAIADGVSDILDLGVTKVLVNLLQPIGCLPWNTRASNYTQCSSAKELVTDTHNKQLREKLGSEDSVLLLDIAGAFNQIIQAKTDTTGFLHRMAPCCESPEDSYCGAVNKAGEPQYEVCANPRRYFYFDEWHPTQAGWSAVMDQLEDPIREFLGISD